MLNLIVCTKIYWKEIYREGSDNVEKRNHSLITFLHVSCHESFLIKSKKDCASWLSACHYGLHYEKTGWFRISMVKRLITMIVIDVEENDDNNMILIYILILLKDLKNAYSWLILNSDDLTIEMLFTKI